MFRRGKRLIGTLVIFLRTEHFDYRVQDLDAAAELIFCTIEKIPLRTVLFESTAGKQRMVEALQEMLTRHQAIAISGHCSNRKTTASFTATPSGSGQIHR